MVLSQGRGKVISRAQNQDDRPNMLNDQQTTDNGHNLGISCFLKLPNICFYAYIFQVY